MPRKLKKVSILFKKKKKTYRAVLEDHTYFTNSRKSNIPQVRDFLPSDINPSINDSQSDELVEEIISFEDMVILNEIPEEGNAAEIEEEIIAEVEDEKKEGTILEKIRTWAITSNQKLTDLLKLLKILKEEGIIKDSTTARKLLSFNIIYKVLKVTYSAKCAVSHIKMTCFLFHH